MSVTLTDRYIDAAVQSLPAHVRDDVRTELTGSIADAVDARIEQGDDSREAERAVLLGMGDPAALAAGFADRPLHLIGPKYFLTWWRLLKLLLVIVPLCATGGVVIAKSAEGAPLGDLIASTIGVALTVAVSVTFWVTLVFAVLERTGSDVAPAWGLDDLPDAEDATDGRGDLIPTVIFIAVGAAALLWDHFIGFVRVDGEIISAINPELWPWIASTLLVLLAAQAALAIAVYAHRHWTIALAVVNTVLELAFTGLLLVLLARGELVNAAFIDYAFTANDVDADTTRILGALLAVGLVLVTGWDIIDGWRRALRRR